MGAMAAMDARRLREEGSSRWSVKVDSRAARQIRLAPRPGAPMLITDAFLIDHRGDPSAAVMAFVRTRQEEQWHSTVSVKKPHADRVTLLDEPFELDLQFTSTINDPAAVVQFEGYILAPPPPPPPPPAPAPAPERMRVRTRIHGPREGGSVGRLAVADRMLIGLFLFVYAILLLGLFRFFHG